MNVEVAVPISTIMTANVITVKPNDSLEKAETLFKKHKIRHIPVVDKKRLVGMLSMNDLLRISFADGAYEDEEEIETVVYEMFSLPQVMAKSIKTVNPETTIKEVAELLAKEEFHALPIVDGGNLVGIVTTTDLIKYLLNQY